jgi:hypothetical protein
VNDNPTRYRIARWLRALFEGPRATPSRPEKLVLRHVTLNERQVDIGLFPVSPAANDNGQDLGDLAMRIEETAHDDAEGLGGLQRYVIHAIAEDRPLSRLPFRISGGGEVATSGIDEPLDSEPASGRGLLAQGMRHLEVMTRLHAEAVGQLVVTQQRTIARLAEVNESGEERRIKAVETAEAMISEKQERVLKAQESIQRQNLISRAVGEILPVPGAILDFLSGAGEKRAKELIGMHSQLLKSFARDPARLEKLLAMLSPEERALFEAIFNSVPPPPEEPGPAAEDGDPPRRGPGPEPPGPPPPRGGSQGPRPSAPSGPSPPPAAPAGDDARPAQGGPGARPQARTRTPSARPGGRP